MTRRARSQSWRLSKIVHASSDLPATLNISSFPSLFCSSFNTEYVSPPILLHHSMSIGPLSPTSPILPEPSIALKTKESGRGPNNSQNSSYKHAGIHHPKPRFPELSCSSNFATCEYITKPRNHKPSQVVLHLPSWS